MTDKIIKFNDLKENTKELIRKEFEFLKTEQKHLKDCQIQILAYSISATALILAYSSSKLTQPTIDSILLFLVPIGILIPSWDIFFSKAQNLTRITSYYQVIEDCFLNGFYFSFCGWEKSIKTWENARGKATSCEFFGLTPQSNNILIRNRCLIFKKIDTHKNQLLRSRIESKNYILLWRMIIYINYYFQFLFFTIFKNFLSFLNVYCPYSFENQEIKTKCLSEFYDWKRSDIKEYEGYSLSEDKRGIYFCDKHRECGFPEDNKINRTDGITRFYKHTIFFLNSIIHFPNRIPYWVLIYRIYFWLIIFSLLLSIYSLLKSDYPIIINHFQELLSLFLGVFILIVLISVQVPLFEVIVEFLNKALLKIINDGQEVKSFLRNSYPYIFFSGIYYLFIIDLLCLLGISTIIVTFFNVNFIQFFFNLSFSIIAHYSFFTRYILLLIVTYIVAITARHNLMILFDLTQGSQSYQCNFYYWKKLLGENYPIIEEDTYPEMYY